MSNLTPDALVEEVARAHYEAVNMRVHGHVLPAWNALPETNRDWFRADMRAALAAVAKRAFVDGADEARVQAAYATPPVAALLRTLAEAAQQEPRDG